VEAFGVLIKFKMALPWKPLCLSQARTWISNVACHCLVVFNDFILALELMSTTIKSDTSINGMKLTTRNIYLVKKKYDGVVPVNGIPTLPL
jgi:hypothetical protein